jgi:hypothetical protein
MPDDALRIVMRGADKEDRAVAARPRCASVTDKDIATAQIFRDLRATALDRTY